MATTTACGLGLADEPGRATIGTPTTDGAPVDPFSTGGHVPTPFVPYASQGTDLDPALRGLGVAAPTSSAPAPPPIAVSPPVPQPVGGGDLVPVTIFGATPPTSTAKTEPAKTTETAKQPAAATPEPLTPIRPAATSNPRPATTAAKEKKSTKADGAKSAPTATTPKSAESETARPPIRFSFPQPIIPLESALRKWFGRSPNRG